MSKIDIVLVIALFYEVIMMQRKICRSIFNLNLIELKLVRAITAGVMRSCLLVDWSGITSK